MNFKTCIDTIFKLTFWYTTDRHTFIESIVLTLYLLNPLLCVHYYVSYDSSHDTLFVQHAFFLHWNFLQRKAFRPC